MSDESTSSHTIGASVDAYLAQQDLRAASTFATVANYWESVVGPDMAKHVKPMSMRAEILVLGVDHPTWATEVKFNIRDIMDSLNQHLGGTVIAEVKLHVVGQKSVE